MRPLAILLLLASPAHAETVLLRFHASWCAPCRQMNRVWNTVDPVVRVVDVDLDREPEMARAWKVFTIPQAVLVDVKPDGKSAKELRRMVGAQSREGVLYFLEHK